MNYLTDNDVIILRGIPNSDTITIEFDSILKICTIKTAYKPEGYNLNRYNSVLLQFIDLDNIMKYDLRVTGVYPLNKTICKIPYSGNDKIEIILKYNPNLMLYNKSTDSFRRFNFQHYIINIIDTTIIFNYKQFGRNFKTNRFYSINGINEGVITSEPSEPPLDPPAPPPIPPPITPPPITPPITPPPTPPITPPPTPPITPPPTPPESEPDSESEEKKTYDYIKIYVIIFILIIILYYLIFNGVSNRLDNLYINVI
ncbi:hypothetical protein MYSEV_155 [Mythimna separata entomopoxvirus 'L']|uniref:Uncharacterized protein n=1 Tax=Mythimna separata entomopoxvirus 'L' TaxID=1293572 RepID=A0A916KQ83_9POXV|nr:hypothetical protein MYSEV_155 [Mythimna separata entomopoxvirus 'L']CCU56353.1 hypothetical protein MYSEV_155 [Mythimna separata entomopoxvirus 'L']